MWLPDYCLHSVVFLLSVWRHINILFNFVQRCTHFKSRALFSKRRLEPPSVFDFTCFVSLSTRDKIHNETINQTQSLHSFPCCLLTPWGQTGNCNNYFSLRLSIYQGTNQLTFKWLGLLNFHLLNAWLTLLIWIWPFLQMMMIHWANTSSWLYCIVITSENNLVCTCPLFKLTCFDCVCVVEWHVTSCI